MRSLTLAICIAAAIAAFPLTGVAAGESPSAHAGGLICFTPKLPPPDAGKTTPSCDMLCAAQHAACTGVTSHINPPPDCATPIDALIATCRCCKLAR